MNKRRKTVAILGVTFLVLLYGSTLFFALFDNSEGMIYFKTAASGSIFFPIILYAMSIYHRLAQNNSDTNEEKKES